MIKKYTQYVNEGILDKMIGPSIEEMLKNSPTDAFMFGVRDLNYDLMKSAIEHGADLNRKKDSYLPIRIAISTKNIELLKFLLDNGFYVTYKHFLLLVYVDDNNFFEQTIKLFLEYIDKSSQNIYNIIYEYLYYIHKNKFNIYKIKNEIINKIKLFLKYNLYNKEDINKSFSFIIKYGIYELIDEFIKRGADIDKFKKLDKTFDKSVKLNDISLTIKKLLKYD